MRPVRRLIHTRPAVARLWRALPREVSAAHPVTNLRCCVPEEQPNGSAAQRALRRQLLNDHAWHQPFWSDHNTRFNQEKQKFIQDYKQRHALGDEERVPADELAVFYREFLNSNRQLHRDYNIAWYGRNFRNLGLWLRARLGL